MAYLAHFLLPALQIAATHQSSEDAKCTEPSHPRRAPDPALAAALADWVREPGLASQEAQARARCASKVQAWQLLNHGRPPARTTPLDLGYLGLTSLPPALGLLDELRDIRLAGNALTDLPIEMGQLHNLERLDLWGNRLAHVPAVVGRMDHLKELGLDHNRLLAELPDEIRGLRNLESLSAQFCALTQLPEAIGELGHLRVLDLDCNNLTDMPRALAALKALRELHLASNDLAHFPDGVLELPELTRLHLSFNPRITLPAQVAQLANLRNLFLMHNTAITDLPEQIVQLARTCRVVVSGCPLPETTIDALRVAEAERARTQPACEHLASLPARVPVAPAFSRCRFAAPARARLSDEMPVRRTPARWPRQEF